MPDDHRRARRTHRGSRHHHRRVEAGVVTDVRLDIVEPARFFESMVVGRRFDEAPLITRRICGICSPNHALTSIKAIEAAMGVEVSERTVLLRKLLVYGSYLQNHATHLYLFAAPDYVGAGERVPARARRTPTSSSARCASRSSATS